MEEMVCSAREEMKNAQAAGDPDLGATYYNHWLETRRAMVVEKDCATEKTLVNTAIAMAGGCARHTAGRANCPWKH